MKNTTKVKTVLIGILITGLIGLWVPLHVSAHTLFLESDQERLAPGQPLTVDILVDDPAGVSGAVFSLNYPANILRLDPTPVTSVFFSSESTLGVWSANTDERGAISLTGLILDSGAAGNSVPSGSGNSSLFTVHFHVKSNAPPGSFNLELQQSNLCNGPAGWGVDHNNNGRYDPGDGDVKQAVPLLYAVRYNVDGQDGATPVESEVLLEAFDTDPGISFRVLSTGGGGTDECPDDPYKNNPGVCGCGVPDTDSNGNGIPDCIEVLIHPAGNEKGVGLSPRFEVLPFPDLDQAGPDAGIVWQISRSSDFSDLLFDMTGPPDQPAFNLPDFILDGRTTYYWRISYSDGTQQSGTWDAVGRFETGPDDMVDNNDNGIPDHQDVEPADNLIVAGHPGIDENSLKVLKTDSGGFQYGMLPGAGVAGIDRIRWLDVSGIEGSDQWPVDFPYGLLAFRLYTMTPGAAVEVTVYFSDPLPEGFLWWAYDPGRGLYDYSEHVVISGDRLSARISLTDGGTGDADYVANGVIVDPAGPGYTTDTDGDGVADELDGCPSDPLKTAPGTCGCGVVDTDSDGDGVADCLDGCPNDPGKTSPGGCGCGVSDIDTDGDGVPGCIDGCPSDPLKTAPGACGCGIADTDSDGDGVADCLDGCPNDPGKTSPGGCGCGFADTDSDGDGLADCIDVIVSPANGRQNVSLNPMFKVSPYPDFDHAPADAAIVWQVSKNNGFSDLVYELVGAADVSTMRLPDFILDEFTTYYWRVRYRGLAGQSGDWQAAGYFTTGPATMTDTNGNGIPDDQDVAENENLIEKEYPDIAAGVKVVKAVGDASQAVAAAENGDFQYGLAPDDGVVVIDRVKWLDATGIEGSDAWPVEFPLGLVTFRVYTRTPGATVSVIIYFSDPQKPGSAWWKYDLQQGVYDYTPHAVFDAGGAFVTLKLTDGGTGDADGVANGVIVDPGGIVPAESGGGSSSGCFIRGLFK